ncbi:hypothetical protein M758_2G203400 [Ceratodon purpureus]|nr:hypothetical protein M758_2G203400 [Ceratodon purpureus]
MTGRGGQGVGVSKEEVVKFLGCIAIVQQLPRASAQRLAEVVEPRNYGEGEIIVQEGALGGLYFLWKGEAKISFVSSPLGSEDQATCTEVTLKSGDYFGYGEVMIRYPCNDQILEKSCMTACDRLANFRRDHCSSKGRPQIYSHCHNRG